MKTSCIPHPPGEPLVLIRTWQVEACGGNLCAAALLTFFEYWHNIKLNGHEQARAMNDVAEKHGDARSQEESLLQWHSTEQLQKGVLGLYGESVIQKSVKHLASLGFITIQNNPNPDYKWDKTHFYLFQPEVIMTWLRANRGLDTDYSPRAPVKSDAVKIRHRERENTASTSQKYGIENVKIRHRRLKNTAAITEITTESKETTLRPKRAKGYADYPGFCELWDIAVVRPTGSKGNKQESLQAWKTHGLETNPSLAEEVLQAYAYQKTTAKWQENGGEYVPELQRWLKPKRWEGVTVPEGFDRHRPWQPTPRSYESHPGGGLKGEL